MPLTSRVERRRPRAQEPGDRRLGRGDANRGADPRMPRRRRRRGRREVDERVGGGEGASCAPPSTSLLDERLRRAPARPRGARRLALLPLRPRRRAVRASGSRRWPSSTRRARRDAYVVAEPDRRPTPSAAVAHGARVRAGRAALARAERRRAARASEAAAGAIRHRAAELVRPVRDAVSHPAHGEARRGADPVARRPRRSTRAPTRSCSPARHMGFLPDLGRPAGRCSGTFAAIGGAWALPAHAAPGGEGPRSAAGRTLPLVGTNGARDGARRRRCCSRARARCSSPAS